ncbi:MAG: hypothetical protein H6605_04220 [Flavobacteriales bacterium]|nr:hypothetical protein [Flavobacteriales bacterium]
MTGKLTALLIAVPVLLLTCTVPNHGDSSFYHAQAILWTEQFPAIPGLANFFSRLGYHSVFFNVQSAFSFYPFFYEPSRFLNGFLASVWLMHLLGICFSDTQSDQRKLNAFVFCLISLFIIRGWVSSVAPDVAAGLIMLFFTFELVSGSNTKTRSEPVYLFALLALGFCVKISMLFFFPLTLLIPDIIKRTGIKSVLLPALLFVPFLIKNIVLSGYLVFPYLPVPFSPDWQVPDAIAAIDRNWIQSWAKIPGEPWQDVLSKSVSEWFPVWFKNQSSINKLITLIYLISFVFLILSNLIRSIKKKSLALSQFGLILWGSVIFIWFFYAPDYRFGYGLILPFIYLTYSKKILSLSPGFLLKKNAIFLATFLSMTLLCFYVYHKENVKLTEIWVLPQNYPQASYQNSGIDYLKINVVDHNCWNTPIPCIRKDLFPENVKMRGPHIEDGFRYVKPD